MYALNNSIFLSKLMHFCVDNVFSECIILAADNIIFSCNVIPGVSNINFCDRGIYKRFF